MAKTRAKKEKTLEALTTSLQGMRSMVFAQYEGLKVCDVEELRRTLAKENVEYTVAKKTLLGLALKNAGLSIDPHAISGNFATIISHDDEVAPARILATFAKDHEALKITAGILEGKLMDRAAIIALAKLPSKQELLAKVVGSINAPISGLVNVLAGNLRGLLNVLTAIKDQKPA